MRRARNREGSLRQRADGVWELRVQRDGVRQSFYGSTRTEVLRKAERAKARTVHEAKQRETVAGWIERWLADMEGGGLKPATVRKYRIDTRNNVVPHLGHLRLDQVTTADVANLQARLRAEGKAPQTVIHARRSLGTALEAAVDAGLIASNPTRSRSLRQRVPEKVDRVLTREETRRLLDAASGSRYEALFLLAVTTGMREGELLALRWRDLDLDAGILSVRGSVSVGHDGQLRILPPKTRRSRRRVYLPDIATEALRRARHQDADIVFPAARGGLMRGTNLHARHFLPLLDQAGLRPMKFHDLRDTAATHMLEDGTPLNVVSEVLGHADEAITLRRYAHVTRGMQRAALIAMNARYGRQ